MMGCIQDGKRGSGMAIPEKKKIGAGASREIPSPDTVHNNDIVSNATSDAASNNAPDTDTMNNRAAVIDAGIRISKNNPAKTKMGGARNSIGAARPLKARVNHNA